MKTREHLQKLVKGTEFEIRMHQSHLEWLEEMLALTDDELDVLANTRGHAVWLCMERQRKGKK